MPVVVIDEHIEHALEVTRVQNKQPIEAPGANSPDESFGDPVRLRRLNRRPNNADTRPLKHLLKAAREFGLFTDLSTTI